VMVELCGGGCGEWVVAGGGVAVVVRGDLVVVVVFGGEAEVAQIRFKVVRLR